MMGTRSVSEGEVERAMNDIQNSPEPVYSEDKVMLLLAYLNLFALIPFFIAQREYVKWHAKQGLMLCIVTWIAVVALGILAFVPILGMLLSVFFSLGVLALSLLATVKALEGIRWPIPLVSDWTKKFFP